jgi:hypothetical protein
MKIKEKRQINNYGTDYTQTYGGGMGGMPPVKTTMVQDILKHMESVVLVKFYYIF